MGFEPTRAEHIGSAAQRLNHALGRLVRPVLKRSKLRGYITTCYFQKTCPIINVLRTFLEKEGHDIRRPLLSCYTKWSHLIYSFSCNSCAAV